VLRLRRPAADEHGFRAVVAIVPYLDERGQPDAFRLAYDVVEHEVRRAGLGVIQLREDLVELGLERARDGRANALHPGPSGHLRIAEALHRDLEI
jgi:hypothetical protein